MKSCYFLRFVLVSMVFLLCAVVPVSAQEKVVYEEYLQEITRWEQREQAVLDEIAKLEAEIFTLQGEIDSLGQMYIDAWNEIHELLGIEKPVIQPEGKAVEEPPEIKAWLRDFQALERDIEAFEQETPEGIYRREAELVELERRLKELSSTRITLLTKYMNMSDELFARLKTIRARMAKPREKFYTVIEGDNLWQIARMEQYFSDPMKWMRIYSKNSVQINNPDLIRPNQRFSIPLDIDRKIQYIVSQGEFLKSIAEKLYGDPSRWRELYQNNMQMIEDPNLIYPEMILSVPEQ